jgi:hypothetical protein
LRARFRLLAKKKESPASSPGEQKRAVHALNRLTFGPRPGDVQRVMAIGVDAHGSTSNSIPAKLMMTLWKAGSRRFARCA